MSIFCCGPVNLSILTFPNISLTKTDFFFFGKSLKQAAIYLISDFVISDVDFPSWPDKSVNTNFWQYQSDRDSGKFICYLEIQSKIAEIISVCILNPLRLSLTGFYLGLKLQFKFKLQWEKVCFKLNICKRDLKPKKVKPIYQIFFDIVV